MKNIISVFAIVLLTGYNLSGQNYSSIKAKEEFDLLNALQVNQYDPCGASPNNDQDVFGDGMSYILDGYITSHLQHGH